MVGMVVIVDVGVLLSLMFGDNGCSKRRFVAVAMLVGVGGVGGSGDSESGFGKAFHFLYSFVTSQELETIG